MKLHLILFTNRYWNVFDKQWYNLIASILIS